MSGELVQKYKWVLDLAKAAFPTVPFRLDESDYGANCRLGARIGPAGPERKAFGVYLVNIDSLFVLGNLGDEEQKLWVDAMLDQAATDLGVARIRSDALR